MTERLRRRRHGGVASLMAAFVLLVTMPAQAQIQSSAAPARVQLALDKNAPGDIPDSQVFVTYRSSQGYSIKVPEGWARSEERGSVRFTDKYNAIRIEVSARAVPPTVAEVRSGANAAHRPQTKAFEITDVRPARFPAGEAVVARFRADSQPNPVTGKAIRLDGENIHFWRAGQQVVITLTAPAGADNVDQWHLMTNSFAWTPAKP